MRNLEFYIVDVFAEEKYAGNQLAVFREAGGLSASDMQKLAKEMNYSESTFILSEEPIGGGYDVRIFTPDAEVPFAGHPTLGTAYVIQREIVGKPVDGIALNLKVGQIPVTFTYEDGTVGALWMRQRPPVGGKVVDPASMAAVLGICENEIDTRFPIQEFSTGLPFVITPLESLASLKRIRLDAEGLARLVEPLDAKAVLVFSPEAYSDEHDLAVRVFAGLYGVPEDPATGSANGCLAGYLVHHGYFGGTSIDLKVDQGFEIGRPSLLLLKASRSGTQIDVMVGGRVMMVAKGRLID